jgi:uncharacterized membrane protein YozB (DUF420 family)
MIGHRGTEGTESESLMLCDFSVLSVPLCGNTLTPDPKEFFAAVNASLNGISGLLIVVGYFFIKRRHIARRNMIVHVWLMSSALIFSSAFLVLYIYTHARYGERTTSLAHGPLRTAYLIMLASHILLAACVLPMIVITVIHAYKRRWDKHRKLARPTFWIWLYVSVTGVLVYVLLYHVFPAPMQAAG